jgi:hypothetical protein
MFHDERAAMCRAGRLLGVRHAVPDEPAMIEAIILDFEGGSWTLTVNADDDTIRIVEGEPIGLEDARIGPAPAESPWAGTLGTAPQWIWVLENQQGYHDGLQICFALDGSEVCRIQLIAMASSWHIGMVHRWPATTPENQALKLPAQH